MPDLADRIIQAALVGTLDTSQLQDELDRVARALANAADRPGVLLDCTEMTGYDLAARELFVQWNAAHRESIAGLAVVLHRPMWFAVVATMALLARQQMRAFRTSPAANEWLSEL